ncbi:enoyl-CoA hydratase/isomerase family protein [Mucilaginibacter angelicae]|uniref:Enoyl-CoA hydratase/isomerase family protein n=1 Tax=Mucilaginibacter angelicae TaxID=869718 RepID=A0ABV6L117_9SPHI
MNGKALNINLSDLAQNGIAIDLEKIRSNGKIYLENNGATILDAGDGIGIIEFHTKANALNDEISEIIINGCEKGSKEFKGLVIGNTGKHFSAGANLALILETAKSGKWNVLENTILNLQHATMALKLSPVPVVAAPFSSVLGGGCEVCLHSTFVVASSETHMGLVETGVGLIPAGGGTKELIVRAFYKAAKTGIPPAQLLMQVAENILKAKVSRNGEEAKNIFLNEDDLVISTPVSPTGAAKKVAMIISEDYIPKKMRNDIPVLGRNAFTAFDEKVKSAIDSKAMTVHDGVIAGHIANIMCGGGQAGGFTSEQYFLDLERQAFLSLLGTDQTQERISYLLGNNKPLHN